MIMNLYSSWKSENTQNRLGYGIHDNVVIKKVDDEPRKKSDGSILKVSMFITYAQVDPEGAPLAEHEEFLFWPKHDSKIGALPALFSYINKLSAILSCYYPADQINQNFDGVLNSLGFDTQEKFEKSIATPKGMTTATSTLNKAFIQWITPLLGLKSQYKFRLKITWQDDGRGLEIPSTNFIEPLHTPLAQSALAMNHRDIRAKAEAEKPKARTDLGTAGGPAMPGAPMGVPGVPVNIPGAPSNIPGAPVNIPGAPVNIPGTSAAVPGPVANGPATPVVQPVADQPEQLAAPVLAPGQIAMPFLQS